MGRQSMTFPACPFILYIIAIIIFSTIYNCNYLLLLFVIITLLVSYITISIGPLQYHISIAVLNCRRYYYFYDYVCMCIISYIILPNMKYINNTIPFHISMDWFKGKSKPETGNHRFSH